MATKQELEKEIELLKREISKLESWIRKHVVDETQKKFPPRQFR